jgi:hypothetical protein
MIATLLLWLLGIGVALAIALLWRRRDYTPSWVPWAFIVGAVALPFPSWLFAAVSCGL